MIQVNTEPSSKRNSREGVETTKVFQNGKRVGCLKVILRQQREGTFYKVYDIVRTAWRYAELSRNNSTGYIVTSNNIVILIEDRQKLSSLNWVNSVEPVVLETIKLETGNTEPSHSRDIMEGVETQMKQPERLSLSLSLSDFTIERPTLVFQGEDIVRTVWKHAELSRNILASYIVTSNKLKEIAQASSDLLDEKCIN